METAIMDKQMLINLANDMKKDEIILMSNILQGQVSGSTKKKLKAFSIGFTDDCFKSPETVSDLMRARLFGMIIIKKKDINQSVLKTFEEYQKKNKKVVKKK